MLDKNKQYIDLALEEVQKIYPEIQEVYLPEDIEIGVTHESGELYAFQASRLAQSTKTPYLCTVQKLNYDANSRRTL